MADPGATPRGMLERNEAAAVRSGTEHAELGGNF